MTFLQSIQSEWMKTRRSTAAVLVITGALFIPSIIIFMRFVQREKLAAVYQSGSFWHNHFFKNWQVMAFLLLPLGVILCVSLITQLEYRNNTWKQLHTTPQSFTSIFFAKLTVILLMLLQFFVLFNIAIYISAVVPLLFSTKAVYPLQAIPWSDLLLVNVKFFIACLPVLAIQYLLSLRIKNFMLPLGAGIVLLVASTFAIQWEYGYMIPFTYTGYTYILNASASPEIKMPVNILLLSVIMFAAFTIIGYWLYSSKKDKC